jgi:hypothetical protein
MSRVLVIAAILVAVSIVSVIARAAIRRRHQIVAFDLADLEPGAQVVVFTSPYCHGCRQWLDALAEEHVSAQAIDVAERPEAAAKYKVGVTPRVAVVDQRGGAVLRQFDHYSPRRHDLDAIARIVARA